MAKHSDAVRKISSKRKDNPPPVRSKARKKSQLPIINTVMIIGIYVILLKEYWLPWIME